MPPEKLAPQLQNFSRDVGWERQVALFGDEARAWIETFHDIGCAGPSSDSNQVVKLLHQGEIGQASELVTRLWHQISTFDQAPGSMALVMQRWFFTAAAYLDYLRGDLDRAENKLATAGRAVGGAIQRRPFLLPLAVHCIDFYQQAVRISRQRLCWSEMKHRLKHLRSVYAGDAPLCHLEGGSSVDFSVLTSAYDQFAEETRDPEDPFLQFLGSREIRLESFERAAVRLAVDPRILSPHV